VELAKGEKTMKIIALLNLRKAGLTEEEFLRFF
jgi:hypothetical protein